jgi:transposase
MICIDARHAKAVLKMQINKSDRNHAAGIARIMQTGWFKEVRVKDLDSHSVRALLASRALLVKIKRDLENQIRGLLKNVGLVIGRAKFNVFAVRAEELIEDRPELIAVVGPLLKARQAIEQQTDDLDRKVLKLARYDTQVRRFMTVPGVGPITALCFKATIDDPTRFKRSRSVGAYVGLTTRRHASGEIDWTGRISKCGDAMLRSYLFEAAGVLLTRVPKWSALKAWGMRLAKRTGLRKATVAVARKLARMMGGDVTGAGQRLRVYRAPAGRRGESIALGPTDTGRCVMALRSYSVILASLLLSTLIAAPAAAVCKSPRSICKHIDECLQRTSDPNNKAAEQIREGVKTRSGKIVWAGAEACARDLGRKRQWDDWTRQCSDVEYVSIAKVEMEIGKAYCDRYSQ